MDDEWLDDMLDRFSHGADPFFTIDIRYGRTKEEAKQAIAAHFSQKLELAALKAHRTPIMQYDRTTAIAVKRLCEERLAQLDKEIKQRSGDNE